MKWALIYCLLQLLSSISFFAKVFKWNWESKEWYFAPVFTWLCHGIHARDFMVLLYITTYCNFIKWKVQSEILHKDWAGLLTWRQYSAEFGIFSLLKCHGCTVVYVWLENNHHFIMNLGSLTIRELLYYSTYFYLPFVSWSKMDLYNLTRCMELVFQVHIIRYSKKSMLILDGFSIAASRCI